MPAATQKTTKVVTEFTDAQGKRWKVGDNFTGDDKARQAAIAAGQVQEQPAPDPNAAE
jgi:hypothetical protein